MSTFLWAMFGVMVFCGYITLLVWTFMTFMEAVDGDESWHRAIAFIVALVVVTAAGITLMVNSIEEECPPGTTREYHATGDRSGYHYCLGTPR